MGVNENATASHGLKLYFRDYFSVVRELISHNRRQLTAERFGRTINISKFIYSDDMGYTGAEISVIRCLRHLGSAHESETETNADRFLNG